MKRVIAFFLLCSSAFASIPVYELKTELMINGKRVAAPQVSVKDKETVTILDESGPTTRFIEVAATKGFDNEIQMNFVVGTIENGERKILSRPQMLVEQNRKALIETKDSEGETLSLSVIANPIL